MNIDDIKYVSWTGIIFGKKITYFWNIVRENGKIYYENDCTDKTEIHPNHLINLSTAGTGYTLLNEQDYLVYLLKHCENK